MYARVLCAAELLRPSRMVRSGNTGIAVESALPPDVRRRLCPAVSSAAFTLGSAHWFLTYSMLSAKTNKRA
jgi:hypothetical protein